MTEPGKPKQHDPSAAENLAADPEPGLKGTRFTEAADLESLADRDLERRNTISEILSRELDVRSKRRAEARIRRARALEVAAAVVPAIAVAGSVLLGVATFAWDMRKDREFQVTQEMVQLVRDLSDPEEKRQRTAAVALALLGEPALSILIANLAIDHTDDVYDGIERSISDILESEDSTILISRSIEELGELLSDQLEKSTVPDRSVAALIRTLGSVGSGETEAALKVLTAARSAISRAVKEERLMNELAGPVRETLRSSISDLGTVR